jgi:EF-hand domain pair
MYVLLSLSLSLLFFFLLIFLLSVSFRLYDVNRDGTIDREELFQMLKAIVYDTFLVDLAEDDLRQLVESTFAETDADGDGQIDLEEYKELVRKYPNIVRNLKVDRSVLWDAGVRRNNSVETLKGSPSSGSSPDAASPPRHQRQRRHQQRQQQHGSPIGGGGPMPRLMRAYSTSVLLARSPPSSENVRSLFNCDRSESSRHYAERRQRHHERRRRRRRRKRRKDKDGSSSSTLSSSESSESSSSTSSSGDGNSEDFDDDQYDSVPRRRRSESGGSGSKRTSQRRASIAARTHPFVPSASLSSLLPSFMQPSDSSEDDRHRGNADSLPSSLSSSSSSSGDDDSFASVRSKSASSSGSSLADMVVAGDKNHGNEAGAESALLRGGLGASMPSLHQLKGWVDRLAFGDDSDSSEQ